VGVHGQLGCRKVAQIPPQGLTHPATLGSQRQSTNLNTKVIFFIPSSGKFFDLFYEKIMNLKINLILIKHFCSDFSFRTQRVCAGWT